MALNYEEIKRDPQRISKIKPFISKYNWKVRNYPSKIDDWKTFAKNNLTIALNILYTKEKEILSAYISKYNSNREKQIVILMILNEGNEGREAKSKGRSQYFAVKKIIYSIKTNNIRTS